MKSIRILSTQTFSSSSFWLHINPTIQTDMTHNRCVQRKLRSETDNQACQSFGAFFFFFLKWEKRIKKGLFGSNSPGRCSRHLFLIFYMLSIPLHGSKGHFIFPPSPHDAQWGMRQTLAGADWITVYHFCHSPRWHTGAGPGPPKTRPYWLVRGALFSALIPCITCALKSCSIVIVKWL